MAVFEEVWLFLKGFWLLAALNQHGCTPNLKIEFYKKIPFCRPPWGPWGSGASEMNNK